METITGLQPGTQYTICLLAHNGSGSTLSAPATVTTAIPPEAPAGEEANSIGATSATLRGVLNPGSERTAEPGSYEFLYRPSAGACEGEGSQVVRGHALGQLKEAVSVQVGLLPNATYTFCLRALNEATPQAEAAVGPPVTFTTTPVPPAIEGESASNQGATSATLSAQINPENSPSSYYFEYGQSEAYGSLTPTLSLGAGSSVVGTQAIVTGLQPGSTYHFRVVATNAKGETSHGADATFTTFPAGIAGLPDGRVYERVTPEFPGDLIALEPRAQDRGEYFGELETELAFRAAADGSALAYLGTSSSEGGFGTSGQFGDEYLARRTSSGWTNSLVQPTTGHRATYEFFSSDLSEGVLNEEYNREASAPGEKYQKLFVRNLSTGAYEPIFDGAAPQREWFEFRTHGVFIRDAGGGEGLLFAGASADLSHRLFEANAALDAEAESAPPSLSQNELYDSYGGQLHLVNVLPNGKAAPGASFGGAKIAGYNSENRQPDLRGDISADGSRIFWTDLEDDTLYLRVNDTQPQSPVNGEGRCSVAADACTVQIDASHGPGSSGGGQFWGATPSGSRVFFTDCNHLTGEYSAEPEGCGRGDLYEYDVESGRLTDLTSDANASDPHGADVQGVVGFSDDGRYLYFVATGVLASGATAGADNLYALHVGEPIRFVAALSERDDSFGYGSDDESPPGDWQPEMGEETSQVTPDGRHVVYTVLGSNFNQQIYMYDFGAERPSCISCSPVGAYEGYQAAAFPVSYSATYTSRVMSSDGDRVFFETQTPLVPQDTNGKYDVYEWERGGSGSCESGKDCVYLLSSGTGSTGANFVDASENGDDVFMVTAAQLGSQPQEETLHIVDAHVGVPVVPPECTGSGCQGVPEAPPIFATPSSVTYEGVGNFAAGEQSAKVGAKAKSKAKKKAKKRKGKKAGRKKGAKRNRGGAKRAGARRVARPDAHRKGVRS